MKRIIPMLMILVFATGIAYAQNYTVFEENFDASLDLPEDWIDLSTDEVTIEEDIGVGGTNAVYFNCWSLMGFIFFDLALATPAVSVPAASTLSFDYRITDWADPDEEGYFGDSMFEVYFTDPDDPEDNEMIWTLDDHVDSANYRTITIPLTDYANQTGRILFYCGVWEDEDFAIHIDNVKITTTTAPPDNDLRAVSVTGSRYPTVGTATTYTVTVRNAGALAVSAGAYTVSLMKVGDNTPLGTETGTLLDVETATTFTFSWTPSAGGIVQLYGDVTFSADEVQGNNQTNNLKINPLTSDMIYVGDPTSNLRDPHNPFYFYWEESLAQTIYLESEIVTQGMISSIAYNFSRTNSDYPDEPKNVKVWMATTTSDEFLSYDDVVPYEDFTLVYNGTIPVDESGVNDIQLNLIAPFPYLGDNLVVMTQKMYEGEYYSYNNNWLSTDTDEQRAIYYYEDDDPLPDLSEGYPDFDVDTIIPNIILTFDAGPFVTLTGTVIDDDSDTPIANAKIAIDGTNRFVMSGEDGTYSFRFFPVGTTAITVTVHGYELFEDDVVTTDGQTTPYNIALTALPKVVVTGTVLASDTEAGLEGATVTLVGYDDYSTETIGSGAFTINGVYANEDYAITVSAPRYVTHTGTITVADVNLTVPNITLVEKINPPQNVTATLDTTTPTTMNIAWDIPSTRASQDFRVNEAIEEGNTESTRAITGYNVYRSTLANIEDENAWTTVQTAVVGTTHADATWGSATDGNYYYIVKAVYTGGTSTGAQSNLVTAGGASVIVNITTSDESPVVGATVHLRHNTTTAITYQATVTTGSSVTIPGVTLGVYTLTVSKPGYIDFVNATADVSANPATFTATLQWLNRIFYENFDALAQPTGWTQNASNPLFPWTFEANTASGQQGQYLWPAHNNSAGMAVGASYDPATGGALSPNNYLITPQLSIPATANAPSLEYYIATYQSWPDHYGVYISTTGTAIANFTLLLEETPPGGSYSDQVWTRRRISLTAYAGENVYIAFRHFQSVDQYYIMLDDVAIYQDINVSIGDSTLPPAVTSLKANYPNPFNPSTTISFDMAREGHVAIDVFNIKGQKVKTLTNDNYGIGSHKVVWNGDDSAGKTVGSGVYFYRMTTDGYTKTQKMLLMK